MENCPAIASFNVVKGFLNLVIAQSAWLGLLADINADFSFQITEISRYVKAEVNQELLVPSTGIPLS